MRSRRAIISNLRTEDGQLGAFEMIIIGFVVVVGLLLGLTVFRDALVTAFQRLADVILGL